MSQLEERLPELFRQLDRVQEMLPKGHFEIAARQALIGSDIDALFTWVRDETIALPYDGILRGARGTLMDRGGSSLDRSLLLLELLQAAGHNVRLATGPLDDRGRSGLVSALGDRMPALDRLGHDDPEPAELELLSNLGLSPDQLDTINRGAQTQSEALRDRAQALADRQTEALAGHLASTDGASNWQPMEHWWVQVQTADGWQDLDPILGDHRPGDRLAERITASYWPEELDENEHHRLTVRVIAEQQQRGRLTEHLAFEETLRVVDLHGLPLRLEVQPLGLGRVSDLLSLPERVWQLEQTLAAVDGWVPILTVGNESRSQMSIQTDGSVSDAFRRPATARGIGAVTGALGGLSVGGGRSPRAPTSALTAAYIEYRIEAPGRDADTFRRTVMDMIGEDARQADRPARLDWDEAHRLVRAFGMMAAVEILPQTHWWPASFASGYAIHDLQRNRLPLLTATQAWQQGDLTLLGRALEAIELSSAPLNTLALLRSAFSEEYRRLAVTRINLLTEYEQIEWRDGEPLLASGIDIIDNRVAALGRQDTAARARLHQGALDTVLEAMVLEMHREIAPANAALRHIQDLDAARAWTRLDPGALGPDSARPVELPGAAWAALGEGWTVLVQPPDLATDGGPWWWRLDPASGSLLGMGPSGRGQAATEAFLTQLDAMNNAGSAAMMAHTIMACVWDARNPNDPQAGASQALCCTARAGASYGVGKITSKATGWLSASYARSLELSKVYEAALDHIFGTYVGWAGDAIGHIKGDPCEP